MEVVGLFTYFIMLGLGAASGVGGGPFVIPMLVIFFHFRISNGVPLSMVLEFLCFLTLLVLYLRKRHPETPRKAIFDYDILLAVTPISLLGAELGIVLSKMLSPGMSLAFVWLILGTGVVQTFRKAVLAYREENLKLTQRLLDSE